MTGGQPVRRNALPKLAAAMSLRQLNLSKPQFRQQAAALRHDIETTMNASASHPGVQHIQDLFREKTNDVPLDFGPSHPAENNGQNANCVRCDRPKSQLRFPIRCRAATRETLMSVLVTLQKRTPDPLATLTAALDALVTDPHADVYRLLFGSDTS